MTFWFVQTLNGISFGMLLFLLAAGLSLIYGLMKILNLTHGSFYLLGGYIGLTVIHSTGSFCACDTVRQAWPSPSSARRWSASSCGAFISTICRRRC